MEALTHSIFSTTGSCIVRLKVRSSHLGRVVGGLGAGMGLETEESTDNPMLGKGTERILETGECVDERERRRGPLWASTKKNASLMLKETSMQKELGLGGKGERRAKEVVES